MRAKENTSYLLEDDIILHPYLLEFKDYFINSDFVFGLHCLLLIDKSCDFFCLILFFDLLR